MLVDRARARARLLWLLLLWLLLLPRSLPHVQVLILGVGRAWVSLALEVACHWSSDVGCVLPYGWSWSCQPGRASTSTSPGPFIIGQVRIRRAPSYSSDGGPSYKQNPTGLPARVGRRETRATRPSSAPEAANSARGLLLMLLAGWRRRFRRRKPSEGGGGGTGAWRPRVERQQSEGADESDTTAQRRRRQQR